MFRGWQSTAVVDEELMADDVFAAHDDQDRRYLLAHTSAATWLCAPISERALECVASGRAELRAVFAHSATGMVERLTVRNGAVWAESIVPCSVLTDDDLPRPGVRLCRRELCA
jgi:hypothetical protein